LSLRGDEEIWKYMQRSHAGCKCRNPAWIFCIHHSIERSPAIILHSIYFMISIIPASNHIYI